MFSHPTALALILALGAACPLAPTAESGDTNGEGSSGPADGESSSSGRPPITDSGGTTTNGGESFGTTTTDAGESFGTTTTTDNGESFGTTTTDGGESFGTTTTTTDGGESSGTTTDGGESFGTTATDGGESSGTTTDGGESFGTTTDGGESSGTTTTDGGESSGSGGTEEPPPGEVPNCEDECVVGCEQILAPWLMEDVQVWYSSAARVAMGENGRVFVWAPDSDDLIGDYLNVDHAELRGNVLALSRDGIVELREPISGDLLGEVAVFDDDWGLARDAGYLWVSDPVALSVYEIDGTFRWDRLGNYAGASVLALPDHVHVHGPATGLSVEAIDAATAAVVTTPFDGTFAEWFGDNPRFWTEEADAYRLYDTDGSLLRFAIGEIRFGYGDWVAFGPASDTTVASVDDLDTIQYTATYPQLHDGVLIDGGPTFTEFELVRLSADVLNPELVVGPQYTRNWAFGPDGDWLIGSVFGSVYDADVQPLSDGLVQHVYGAPTGRFGFDNAVEMTRIFDVSPTCVIDPVSTLSRRAGPAGFSGDGTRFADVLSSEEVRLWDVETGTVEQSWPWSVATYIDFRFDVSETGDAVSVAGASQVSWHWFGAFYRTSDADPILEEDMVRPTAVAPTGDLTAYNNTVFDTYEGTSGYLFDNDALVAIFDGAPIGFMDATTLLVAHYQPAPGYCPGPVDNIAYHCDDYVEAELIDETGAVIAAAPIPDPWSFVRVSDTEILLNPQFETDPPPTIYDVYTGDVLWTGPAVDEVPQPGAVPVGLDHVLYRRNNALVLTKWR